MNYKNKLFLFQPRDIMNVGLICSDECKTDFISSDTKHGKHVTRLLFDILHSL